jgi:type IV/VI secretion system ImpK/VasF family protein
VILLDLYEPLFQYICILNRVARKGAAETLDEAGLREAFTSLLAAIKQQAQADPILNLQAEKLEMPMIFFIDSMIAESKLSCAQDWHKNRLAYASNELAGDEKFFDLLDDTLKDTSREATARLAVFYVCLGLGFTGWYAGQPEYLRRKMETIAKRLAGTIDFDSASRICPEAYNYLDTRNLIEPPSTKIGAILLAFLVLTIVAIAFNLYLFRIGTIGLIDSLKEIFRHDLIK